MFAHLFVRGGSLMGWVAVVSCGLATALQAEEPIPASPVSVRTSGPTNRTGWKEGHRDHTWEERSVALDSGKVCYTIKYSACVDPSHPGVRALEEGYIGMPTPSTANWYHSGFMFVRVNGREVGELPLVDMRVTERGSRGACQMVWETPEARVRVQFLMQGGSERLLSQVTCVPKEGKRVEAIDLRFVCYPSYFTSHHHRQGDRTLITPRLVAHEVSTTALDPAADTYLLYEDTVFDVAKGEGDGPCALLFLADEVAAGSVQLSAYPVHTVLKAAPGVQRLRFVVWDFRGRTNAEAVAFLREHGAAARAELSRMEFRPELLAAFDAGAAQAELQGLLKGAGQDGQQQKPTAETLMGKLVDLKTRADAGDWAAEAEFATQYADYDAWRWKLRIYGLLNTAGGGATPVAK